MAVTYLKRADKTPQTGTDEAREIVQAAEGRYPFCL